MGESIPATESPESLRFVMSNMSERRNTLRNLTSVCMRERVCERENVRVYVLYVSPLFDLR